MTIRNTLLRVFFALVLGSIALVGAVSFFQFRQSLQGEIAHNLQYGAGTMLQRIDAFFFERLENIRLWRRLEIMQDIRVEDVDKRLARFLSDLHEGHGNVYRALLCTDKEGRVVAASDPLWLGRVKRIEPPWTETPGQGSSEVVLEPFGAAGEGALAMRATIPDAFGKGELGYLYVILNWNEVQSLLDDAVAGSERGAILLDASGRVIAASAALRQRPGVYALNLADWYRGRPSSDAYIHDGSALGEDNLLVGGAASSGYQRFPGFGWRLLIVEPVDAAFAPIWRLLWAMAAVLLFTLVAAGWISSRLAGRIAQPLAALTEFTRRYRRGEAVPVPAAGNAVSEAVELSRAFAGMIEAVERSREQVVRAGKLAVVGEMAAIMVHEVRTPLGILRSSAQLLERQANLDDKGRELTGFIISETDRLNRLVTLLLECASPRPPHFRHHDVHEIIAHVLELLAAKAEKKAVSLQRHSRAVDAVLYCDREQIIQIFLNLLLNALHFVPEGGRIAVMTAEEQTTLVVRVEDDGPGIPVELRERVFDPFFTRREGGIGLGLTIVQQFVHAHRGEISVTEGVWGGACFTIRFDRQNQTGRE